MRLDINYDSLPKRSVVCIDVVSYFASVEAVRRKIHPLDAYIAVVADKNRPGSVVLAASPKVKAMGIKTGSRVYEIPTDSRITLVEPSMKLYLKVNKMIGDIFKRFVSDEDLFFYSIDESFLDLTASERLFGDKFEMARKIQRTIFKELKLVVTVGMGDNPLLAKLALSAAKKATNGFAYWSYENIKETIWRIPNLKDMWGISDGYVRRLNQLGIHSVFDLAHADKFKLKKHLGILGMQLYYHAWGVDYSRLSERIETKDKSFSKSQILLRDYYKKDEIFVVIREMVDEVATRLRTHKLAAGRVALGITFSHDIEEKGFKHQMLLPRDTNSTRELYIYFHHIFKKFWAGQPVRQIHIVCSKLSPALYEQMDLFISNEISNKNHTLDEVVDEIRLRFGKDSLFWAGSLLPGGTFLKRANHVGGHKG